MVSRYTRHDCDKEQGRYDCDKEYRDKEQARHDCDKEHRDKEHRDKEQVSVSRSFWHQWKRQFDSDHSTSNKKNNKNNKNKKTRNLSSLIPHSPPPLPPPPLPASVFSGVLKEEQEQERERTEREGTEEFCDCPDCKKQDTKPVTRSNTSSSTCQNSVTNTDIFLPSSAPYSEGGSLLHVHVECVPGQQTSLQDIRDSFLPLEMYFIRNLYEMVPGAVWDFLIQCDSPATLVKRIQTLRMTPAGCGISVSVSPVASDKAFNTEMTQRFL